MKNIFLLLSAALLVLFCLSCTSDGNEPDDNNTNLSSSSSSNSGNGGTALSSSGQGSNTGGNCSLESTEQICNFNTGKPYTGSGKVYLADKRNPNTGRPILTEETMLEAGTVNNGKITFALPSNVDSRYIEKIDSAPVGLNVVPLGTEIWFYMDPLRLVNNNGEHIGDLEYAKIIDEDKFYEVSYCYFSEDTKINGSLEENGITMEYKIDAKKGWNKIYTNTDINKGVYATTDLSEVPDGLMWLIWLY